MIFYEIELFSTPRFTFANSVEIENYERFFVQKPHWLEITMITEGQIMYEYPDGTSDTVSPGMLTPIFEDLECHTLAVRNEKQSHSTIVGYADYKFTRHDTDGDFDFPSLQERMNKKQIILLPYHYHFGQQCNHILQLIKTTITKINSPHPSDGIHAIGVWFDLCAELTDIVLKALHATYIPYPPSTFRYIQKAKQYMAAHYREKLTAKDVADALDISVGYLHSIFKQASEGGVMTYLTQYRMDIAKQLILNEGFTLKQVGEHLGIDDSAYMSRWFKKCCGISYSQFIQNNNINIIRFNKLDRI